MNQHMPRLTVRLWDSSKVGNVYNWWKELGSTEVRWLEMHVRRARDQCCLCIIHRTVLYLARQRMIVSCWLCRWQRVQVPCTSSARCFCSLSPIVAEWDVHSPIVITGEHLVNAKSCMFEDVERFYHVFNITNHQLCCITLPIIHV